MGTFYNFSLSPNAFHSRMLSRLRRRCDWHSQFASLMFAHERGIIHELDDGMKLMREAHLNLDRKRSQAESVFERYYPGRDLEATWCKPADRYFRYSRHIAQLSRMYVIHLVADLEWGMKGLWETLQASHPPRRALPRLRRKVRKPAHERCRRLLLARYPLPPPGAPSLPRSEIDDSHVMQTVRDLYAIRVHLVHRVSWNTADGRTDTTKRKAFLMRYPGLEYDTKGRGIAEVPLDICEVLTAAVQAYMCSFPRAVIDHSHSLDAWLDKQERSLSSSA